MSQMFSRSVFRVEGFKIISLYEGARNWGMQYVVHILINEQHEYVCKFYLKFVIVVLTFTIKQCYHDVYVASITKNVWIYIAKCCWFIPSFIL
jgi:hypothetical protein